VELLPLSLLAGNSQNERSLFEYIYEQKREGNVVECISFYFLIRTACVTVPYIGVLPK
jgi:hypothetical protein